MEERAPLAWGVGRGSGNRGKQTDTGEHDPRSIDSRLSRPITLGDVDPRRRSPSLLGRGPAIGVALVGVNASLHELGREKRLNARRDDAVNCMIDKLSVASYTGGAGAASSDRSDRE